MARGTLVERVDGPLRWDPSGVQTGTLNFPYYGTTRGPAPLRSRGSSDARRSGRSSSLARRTAMRIPITRRLSEIRFKAGRFASGGLPAQAVLDRLGGSAYVKEFSMWAECSPQPGVYRPILTLALVWRRILLDPRKLFRSALPAMLCNI